MEHTATIWTEFNFSKLMSTNFRIFLTKVFFWKNNLTKVSQEKLSNRGTHGWTSTRFEWQITETNHIVSNLTETTLSYIWYTPLCVTQTHCNLMHTTLGQLLGVLGLQLVILGHPTSCLHMILVRAPPDVFGTLWMHRLVVMVVLKNPVPIRPRWLVAMARLIAEARLIRTYLCFQHIKCRGHN
jgi:hypothetical protein